MMESYFFSAPHRLRFMQSENKPSNARMNDMRELQTSIGYLVTTDFVTEVINTFLPEAQRWCERGRGMVMPEEVWDKLAKDVRKQDEQIFEAIKASNFYPEIAKAFNPDLAVGTIGLFVEQRRAHEPITVLSVPLRELEVNLGPDGMIDDRFMVRWTRNCHVKALLPDAATVSDEDWQDIKEHPKDRTRITWGYWRKWDETDEVWQHTIMLKDKLVHSAVLRGTGCCPLIVGRFNPSADWVWGIGPLIQGIPDLCQIDELEMQKLKNVELHLDPPVAFPNDSMMMIEQGLEAGRAYPITPGTGPDIKAIYQPQSPEVGIYEHQDLEHRLRKLFFVDHPEQTGDTPPTLGQWLDEMARMQRRLGTPGMSFWREICAPTFLRYQYLLEKVRAIEPIVVNGTVVSLRPYNPTQRAAEQQEIALAAQFAQMMSQMFPEEWKMAVDGRLTMEAFMNKMRVDGLIKFRDPKQVQQFVQQMQPLLQASQRASSGVAQAGGNGAAAPAGATIPAQAAA
jgi:hypothetical protein